MDQEEAQINEAESLLMLENRQVTQGKGEHIII